MKTTLRSNFVLPFALGIVHFSCSDSAPLAGGIDRNTPPNVKEETSPSEEKIPENENTSNDPVGTGTNVGNNQTSPNGTNPNSTSPTNSNTLPTVGDFLGAVIENLPQGNGGPSNSTSEIRDFDIIITRLHAAAYLIDSASISVLGISGRWHIHQSGRPNGRGFGQQEVHDEGKIRELQYVLLAINAKCFRPKIEKDFCVQNFEP